MREFRKFRNRIALVSATLTVSTALVLLQIGLSPIAIGVVLGGTASIAKLWISAARIMKIGNGDDQAVGGKVRAAMTNMVVRYGLIAMSLAIGFFFDWINIFAVAAAVFMTNVVLIASEVARIYFPGAVDAFFGRAHAHAGEN